MVGGTVGGMVAAAVAFFTRRRTALALLYIIAVWALLIGILKIANAIRHRKQIGSEGLICLCPLQLQFPAAQSNQQDDQIKH